MTTAAEWDHKDEWRKFGKDFMVTISRHNGTTDHWDGPNRWAVYAFIYPKHPHFAAFDGPSMGQEAAAVLPGHSYCSLLEYPERAGVVTSVKAGFDYHHAHDERFTHYATPDEANEVFRDAEELHTWLTERAATDTPAESV